MGTLKFLLYRMKDACYNHCVFAFLIYGLAILAGRIFI